MSIRPTTRWTKTRVGGSVRERGGTEKKGVFECTSSSPRGNHDSTLLFVVTDDLHSVRTIQRYSLGTSTSRSWTLMDVFLVSVSNSSPVHLLSRPQT